MIDKVRELVKKAVAAYQRGLVSEGFQLFAEALRIDPSNRFALSQFAVVAVKENRFDLWIQYLSRADSEENSFQIAFWLSTANRAMGELKDALEWAKESVRRDPSQGPGFNQVGLLSLDLGDWESAEEAFRTAISRDPNVATLHENLGRSLQRQRRFPEARQAFEKAVELDPSKTRILIRWGNNLVRELDYESGLICGRRALEAEPRSVAGLLLAAKALVGLGRAEEAQSFASSALKLEPNSAEAHSVLASVLDSLGKRNEAATEYERSVELYPSQGFSYYGLVRSRKIGRDDAGLLKRMLDLTEEPKTPPEHLTYLHYALGKAREDLGEFQLAMAHYDRANHLAAVVEGPLPDPITGPNPSKYDPNSQGLEDELPIFVVGMMRSGTTLVEQILSSHPKIGAVGEQSFWAIGERSESKPKDLANTYLQLLRKLAPGSTRVVDKMPDNYRRLGLIHASLPKAKIIHVKRHPLDTCLSLWSTPRACPPSWRNEKPAIVEAYFRYLDLMRAWRLVLPSTIMLEVQYEQLIADPEATIRTMVEFCGLPWSEACLHPEANRRAVNTPSVHQARQPIYSSSVSRWKNFEPWLGEFLQLEPSRSAL